MKRLAIIGMGKMGSKYAKLILNDESLGYKLVASTRIRGANIENVKEFMGTFQVYQSDQLLFEAIDKQEFECDTIMIVTPHSAHKYAAIEAFKRNLEVLCDKPAGIYLKDGRQMLEANHNHNLYGFIFHQRTYPIYKFLKEIINENKYGKVKRINYIVTDWFRTQAYYKSDVWRSTYKTDGGGLLLNQSPHSLDLLCYIFGMPKSVRAFCHEGKFHQIEVEDEVTAYLEWEGGISGVFISSTGETPGINRMEISTTKALITVYKDINKIVIKQNEYEADYYINCGLEHPIINELKEEIYEFNNNEAYKDLISSFANNTPISTGEDALMSLYISNAMYLSSWQEKTINFYEIGSKEEIEFENEFQKEMNKRI